jgi:hypothetical protein
MLEEVFPLAQLACLTAEDHAHGVLELHTTQNVKQGWWRVHD